MPKNDNNVKRTYPKRKFGRRNNSSNIKVETLEVYDKIILATDGTYQFSNGTKNLDVRSAVRASDEYLSLQKLWIKYKVKSVEAVFKKQINLVDTMLPELLMRFSLIQNDPVINMPINPRACTHWSMLDNKVKKCYAAVNPKFTDRDNCDWQQPTDALFTWMVCSISQAMPGDTLTQPISLGIVKFKVKILAERRDVTNLIQNEKKMKEKIKEQEKEIQQLKKITKEMATQTENPKFVEVGTQTEEEIKEEEKIKEKKKENVEKKVDKKIKKKEEKKEEEDENEDEEEEEEEDEEIDDYEEYLNDMREFAEKDKTDWMKRNSCKTEQEALEKYDKYLRKCIYHDPKPKKGKEYINPMPKQKKNKTFRQGQKKYEKEGLKFDPNLPKGKGCFRKWKNKGENVGVHVEEKDEDEEDYYDPFYENDYDYNNI